MRLAMKTKIAATSIEAIQSTPAVSAQTAPARYQPTRAPMIPRTIVSTKLIPPVLGTTKRAKAPTTSPIGCKGSSSRDRNPLHRHPGQEPTIPRPLLPADLRFMPQSATSQTARLRLLDRAFAKNGVRQWSVFSVDHRPRMLISRQATQEGEAGVSIRTDRTPSSGNSNGGPSQSPSLVEPARVVIAMTESSDPRAVT